jgi:hypothetical protein
VSTPFDDDNEKTVIRPSAAPQAPSMPEASWGPGSGPQREDEHNALPIGTKIAEFEVMRLIGVGGFGIVYLAHDHSLGRPVALKEYMPGSLAARTDGITVAVRSQRDADTFAAGLRSFINEARLLARFDHPSLVKVYRFWEANGTAYMVMPFYEGSTLKEALQAMGKPPSEEWLMDLLTPLMDALTVLHGEDCFHRDIAPDNILLMRDGHPVLLDFGAARRVIGDMAKNLTVILKPGYAPIEQYSDDASVSQGAWTDIYALAAVVRYAITGKPPVPSVTRLVSDSVVALASVAQGQYSERFLQAMDQALSVRPEQRPQSIAALRALLASGGEPRKAAGPGAGRQHARPAALPSPAGVGRSKVLWAAFGLGALLVVGVAGFVVLRSLSEPAVIVAKPKPVPLPAPVSVAPPGPPLGTPPLAPAPTPGVGVPPPSADAPTPTAGSNTTLPPFDPLDALGQLFDQRDPDHAVTVALDQSKVRIGKDKLQFRVRAAKPGYLYVMMVGTDRAHLNLLFPNALDGNNKISGGKEMTLPRSGWTMTAEGPAGVNHFVAMVSDRPIAFTDSGMTKSGPFGEFSLAIISQQVRSNSGGGAALAGKPQCPSPGTCSNAYGAARFSIEEIN